MCNYMLLSFKFVPEVGLGVTALLFAFAYPGSKTLLCFGGLSSLNNLQIETAKALTTLMSPHASLDEVVSPTVKAVAALSNTETQLH